MAKNEITMNMVMEIIMYSMTEYGNTVRALFGCVGEEKMNNGATIPAVVEVKNELHDLFRDLQEKDLLDTMVGERVTEVIWRKYGWMGISYMEASIVLDDRGLITYFTFPSWKDVMKIFTRNILAMGCLNPSHFEDENNWVDDSVRKGLNAVSKAIRSGRVLTRIRSSDRRFSSTNEDGAWYYETAAAMKHYGDDFPDPIEPLDILDIRDNMSLFNLQFIADKKIGDELNKKRHRRLMKEDR